MKLTAGSNIINNFKNVDVIELTDPFIQKIQSIPIKDVIRYIAYLIVLSISINSIKNTKEYIIDNKQKKMKTVIVSSSISLVLLWTAIYFLIK